MDNDQPDFLNDFPTNHNEDNETKYDTVKPLAMSQPNRHSKEGNAKKPKAPCAFVIDMKQKPREDRKAKAHDTSETTVEEEERIECKLCNRKFIKDSYEKHITICGKVFQDKRDKFDTQKQRITEIEQIGHIQKQPNKKRPTLEGTGSIKANGNNPKGQKWSKKSEEFRTIIKMNKSHEKGFGLACQTSPNQAVSLKDDNVIVSATPKAESQSNSFRGDHFVECNLCKKKYTELKYKDHRSDCENKYKDLENKNRIKAKGMQITPLNAVTPFNKGLTTDIGISQEVYQQREEIGMNRKPNCNWGSKPVLNLKFGKK